MVRALESPPPASCKTASTSIDTIHPKNQPRKSKNSYEKSKPPRNCIKLSRPMYTKPRAESVDLEPSPKTGSDKINMLRQRKKNTREKKLYHTALTYKA